jgi:hypothetical protein
MKRALVLSFSPIATDPRVMRQLQALVGRYELTVAGFGVKPPGSFIFHNIEAPSSLSGKIRKALLLLLGFNETFLWGLSYVRKCLAALQGQRFDLVVTNDVNR